MYLLKCQKLALALSLLKLIGCSSAGTRISPNSKAAELQTQHDSLQSSKLNQSEASNTPKACRWTTEQAAVSLTYDDAMPTQLSTAVPLLNELELRGTFFLTDVRHNQGPWAALKRNGHELGFHTFNHPCPASNSWVEPLKSNESYDLERMTTELDEGLVLLKALGQSAPFSFAYPCGETYVGEEKVSYMPLVQERFSAARGVQANSVSRSAEKHNIPAFFLSGNSETMIAQVRKAQETGTWVIFGFHGIGGD